VSTSTPPGWYPDPRGAGHQRYWDGRDWTEQSRPLPPRPAVPAPGTAPAPGSVSDDSPAYGHPAVPEQLVLPGAPVSDASPAYGFPAVPEQLAVPEPVEPGYGCPPPGMYPFEAPPPRRRTGVLAGALAGGVLLALVAAGVSVTVLSGSSAPANGMGAGAAAPVPTVSLPAGLPSEAQPFTVPPSGPSAPSGSSVPSVPSVPPVPMDGHLQDQLHGWSVPVPEGWEEAGHDGTYALLMVTGPYQCATPTGCVRGNFSIDAAPAVGSDAETVARQTMASYAPQIYGQLADHQELTSAPITVAGLKGFAVRWRVVPQQGTPGYLLLVAVPTPDGRFTTMVGSVDDTPKSPDRSVLDQIAAGITPATLPNAA
jgi:hypothetical protein